MNYTFKTAEGRKFTVYAKDADRARCAAKKAAIAAGADWKGAKLVAIDNHL